MTSAVTRIDKDTFGPWAIVTGASSGIGKEFARQLAASGLDLVLVARRLSILEEVGRGLATEFGVRYRTVGVDLTEPDFLETIEAATHDLDVGLLISNAGAGLPGDFLSIDRSRLRGLVQLNVLAHYFGQHLAQRGRGGMLLVSALGAAQGLPYMANDGATKAYVLSLGEALHVEFQKVGVNVTVLVPSPVETPVLAKLGLDATALPIKPMSVEQCVAEGLAALSANRAIHITGRLFRILVAVLPRALMVKMMAGMIGKQVVPTQGTRQEEAGGRGPQAGFRL